MADPTTDDAFDTLTGALKRQSDSTKAAAQRQLQTKYGSRLVGGNSGALAALSAQTDQSADQALDTNVAQIGMQKAQTEQAQSFQAAQNDKDRAIQQQQLDLASKQFDTQTSQWNQEFSENQKTNLYNKLIGINNSNTGSLGDLANILGISGNDPTFGGLVSRSKADNNPSYSV